MPNQTVIVYHSKGEEMLDAAWWHLVETNPWLAGLCIFLFIMFFVGLWVASLWMQERTTFNYNSFGRTMRPPGKRQK